MRLEIHNNHNNDQAFTNFADKKAVCAKPAEIRKLAVYRYDTADFSDEALETVRKTAKSIISKFAAEVEEKPSASDSNIENIENAVEEAVDKIAGQIGKIENGEAEGSKTLSEMVKEQMDKIDSMFGDKDYDKSKDSKLMSIKAKIYRGQNLSSAEQQYLSLKDPDSYSTYQQIASARKMFSCTIRSCRTRDDLISMRLSNSLTALAEFRKATRKGGDGMAIASLNAAIENDIRSYAKTREYQSLPTVAECNKFDRELAKAKRYECEKRREEMKARIDKKYKKKRKNVGDGKRTVAQVMASPLARKVLASRRRTSSCSCGNTGLSLYKF